MYLVIVEVFVQSITNKDPTRVLSVYYYHGTMAIISGRYLLCHKSVRRLFQWLESRYRYVMELNIPGWIVSPLLVKSHMTAPQHTAANTEKWRAFGGTGFTADEAVEAIEYGEVDRGMKDATTREQT